MKVLILSPHPDDMEWNMGGTVIKMIDRGWRVNQIVFSTCIELKGTQFITGAKKTASELNINTRFENYPNQEFANHRSAIREMLYELLEFHYDIIFVPCRQDWHQDHQVVTEETIRVFRKHTTILGYIKEEIFERHYDLKVCLTREQVIRRIEIMRQFGLTVEAVNPEWFEVIQLRNYI